MNIYLVTLENCRLLISEKKTIHLIINTRYTNKLHFCTRKWNTLKTHCEHILCSDTMHILKK